MRDLRFPAMCLVVCFSGLLEVGLIRIVMGVLR